MVTKRYTMGPGTLTLTGPGDVSAQITNTRIEWSESTTNADRIPTLDGGAIEGDSSTTYTAALVGNVVQDIDANGLVQYTWENMGDEVAFVFVPNTAKGRAATGVCRLGPLTLGGDVEDKTPRSDFSWPCIGKPVLGAAA